MKANDIPEAKIIELVMVAMATKGWLTRWDAQKVLSEYPPKVVSAKLNQMVRKGVLNGCASHHDCRGDFTIG